MPGLIRYNNPTLMNGGERIADVLHAWGVPYLFTLCGGHISPILVGCKRRGIRVIDTRHEATAVFAADAVARLTGIPGVAAVTAGPGVTNTITAVKNAQMAQSPVVLLGGAAPTALKGRGALQDIEQMGLFTSLAKWSKSVRFVRDLAPAVEEALFVAQEGIPGPVFVECPVDLLYDEETVRTWYGASRQGRSLPERALKMYLRWHANRLFAGAAEGKTNPPRDVEVQAPSVERLKKAAARLERARSPLLIVGSQALLLAPTAERVARAVERIGVPVYLSGMARGLLGRDHPLHIRHKRRMALKEADVVLLAGVPCDFRLDYGNHIRRSSYFISVNRSLRDLKKNRRPDLAFQAGSGIFLRDLAALMSGPERWSDWLAGLRARDDERDAEIREQAGRDVGKINPLHLCAEIDKFLRDDALLVADGGDFVGTASYITRPPGPLRWLDPGPFGTLGVGAGFALGAKLVHPDAEVWILYGDGSVGYSLTEFDTFVRHGLPVIAVVGNDAGWTQIAREQVEILKDDVGTVLAHTDYDQVADGFGGKGYLLDDPAQIPNVLGRARQAAATRPVLINAILGKTDFRKGSISM